MSAGFSDRVIGVSVTYAGRKALLTQVVAAAQSENVSRMVVVDNGATWPVKQQLTAEFEEFVDVVEMGRNTGSAGGFAAGIGRALELGAEYVWLLDDDNRPETGCLEVLLDALGQPRPGDETGLFAVQASRSAHRASTESSPSAHARKNGFLGFHLADMARKLSRLTPWGKSHIQGEKTLAFDVPVAPYGGLLLPRSTVEAIGLPREDFILYADDLEYTYRITEKGGRISRVRNALVEDLERSWDSGDQSRSSFGILLSEGSDTQAFYGVRNRIYFEANSLRTNRPLFYANAGMQLAILGVLALLLGKWSRFRLVLAAARDGLAGRLGLNPEFKP